MESRHQVDVLESARARRIRKSCRDLLKSKCRVTVEQLQQILAEPFGDGASTYGFRPMPRPASLAGKR
jgi:hypothetical protein